MLTVQGFQSLTSSFSPGIDKCAKSITRRIFQPFCFSQSDERGVYSTVIVVPITSYPLDALFRPLVKGTGIQTQSRAECDRITCISKQLLDNKIGTLEPASLAAVKQGIAFALEFGLD